MPHFRPGALVFLLVATFGCNDITGPTLPATFDLANINGRELPTYFSPTPGPSTTVLFAHLILDNTGKASWFEHRRAFDGAETTVALTFGYSIRGNRIDLGPTQPCPPNANCISLSGSISKDALSIVVVPASVDGPIVYNYRVTAGIRAPA